jgi:predicted DNA-binding protein
MAKVITSHFIERETLERLRALSRQTGLSVSEHVRRALREYLDRQDVPMPVMAEVVND